MKRTTFISGAATSALALARPAISLALPLPALARLETRYGGRLGVAAIDTSSGARMAHRAHERFPMCSTFKVVLVGAVLARVDERRERLDRPVSYSRSDLLSYAPVTRAHLGHRAHGSMSVAALCAAAIEYSDNTAANVLLRACGGPARVTAFARSIGDTVTRLDRTEPSLNTALPGDVRDTTTPAAMAATLRRLALGDVLSAASRHRLNAWLAACQTGGERLRAGLPRHWRAGDKTGTGDRATANDIALFFPPRRSPIVVTAYYTGSRAPEGARDALLAEVGRIVVAAFA